MAKRVIGAALFAVALVSVFPSAVPAGTPDDDCTGSPPEAVMMLPMPLAKWAQISCTPFGHVLSSHEGWAWVWGDGSGSVFIPSQMVERGPRPLGNASYFTKIVLTKVAGDEYDEAYETFHEGLDDGKASKPDGYRVDLTSVSGRTMRLYFFDYDTYAWGMSCPENRCLQTSRFMIVDKANRPQPRRPSI
jgi:hypothetical protein